MELTKPNTRHLLRTLLALCIAITTPAFGQEKDNRSTKEQDTWYEYYTQAMLLRHEPNSSSADVLAGLHKAANYAQKKLKAESYYYVTTARALAKQYEQLGDFEKSESLLLETYQIIMVDKNHNAGKYYTQPLQDLIKFYDRRGELDKKQKYVEEMKEIHKPYLEEMEAAGITPERRKAAAQREAERSPCADNQ